MKKKVYIQKKVPEMELTASGRYYVRRFKNTKTNGVVRIEYYTLDRKEFIPLAKAECGFCKDIIESQKCGDFQMCSCKESFVDTDRWTPERHRYGGNALALTQESWVVY